MNEPLWQAVASIYLIVWFGSLGVFLFAGEPWATIAGGIWIIICPVAFALIVVWAVVLWLLGLFGVKVSMTFGQKFGQK
jgi:hypothetical protein